MTTITFDESLQQYAKRMNMDIKRAYSTWHAHGVQAAQDYAKPLGNHVVVQALNNGSTRLVFAQFPEYFPS